MKICGGGWDAELPGLWIGKYEVSQSDAGTTKDEMGNSGIIQIKPGVTSWRNITIGQMYENAKKYSTELKSHMLKNSEWGAVVYLTHSKYGRNGTEVTKNNNSNFITGNAGDTVNATESTNINQYNTKKGMLASSTGNVYGIYDLSGGAWEYVASYHSKGTDLSYGSTFANGIDDEYSTSYEGDDIEVYFKYGDATKETMKWNNDIVGFVDQKHPFFAKGGYCLYNNAEAGIFAFGNDYGDKREYLSFRVALVIY